MNKHELRKAQLLKRKSYSEASCKDMSDRIAHQFFSSAHLPLSSVSYLHVFLPIAHQNEVDTFPIIHQLRENYPSIRIVLSKTNFSTLSMTHYLYEATTVLKKNSYGIPEPEFGENVETALLDMVLVPLLLADRKGNRIGYGKGFYDRFLATCRPDCIKVGLSFEEPVEEIISEEHDVTIDFCVTPEKVNVLTF